MPSSFKSAAITKVTTESHTILDAKFADDDTLLLLLQSNLDDKPCSIVSIPHGPSTPLTISYAPFAASKLDTALLPNGRPVSESLQEEVTIMPDIIEEHTRHVFEGRFTPLKLVVNGRRDRRVVVVLGSDRKHYRVLDLDYTEGKGDDGSGDKEADSEAESDVEMAEP